MYVKCENEAVESLKRPWMVFDPESIPEGATYYDKKHNLRYVEIDKKPDFDEDGIARVPKKVGEQLIRDPDIPDVKECKSRSEPGANGDESESENQED